MATEELSSSLDQMAMPGRHLFQRATHSAHQDQTCRCSAIYLPGGVLSIGLGVYYSWQTTLGRIHRIFLAVSSQQVFVREGRGRGRERETGGERAAVRSQLDICENSCARTSWSALVEVTNLFSSPSEPHVP